MKIIFIGSILLSKEILMHLLTRKIYIEGVIGLKKNSDISKTDYYDLSIIANKNNIKTISIIDINSNKAINFIKKINPDLIFCIGWSQIIKTPIIKIPKIGIIGYHPADLPRNRGKHPIIWAIALGLREIYSTLFFIDKGVDSGKIFLKDRILIKKNHTATEVYYNLVKTLKKQIIKSIKLIENNNIKLVKQDNRKINYWRKRTFYDGQINWSSSSIIIHNLVRALNYPYPLAHFVYKGKIVKVHKTMLGKNKQINLEYGKVISVKKDFFEIKCGEGSLILIKTRPNLKLKKGEYL